MARSHEKGSAVLEMLIAALVVGFILLALVYFQATLTQSNSYAKSRSLGVTLAQAKLDDLRSFSQIGAGGNGIFGYSEIRANLGGRELGTGALQLPSGTQTVANVNYNLTWACTQRTYPVGGGALPAAVACTGSTATDFKDVTVTVAWLDPLNGGTETVALNSVIHADDPGENATAAVPPLKPKPFISYTPGAGPNFVPVPIAPGVTQEASQPEPDATKFDVATETTFSTIHYSDSTNDVLSRREFVTINCTCLQNGTGMGRTPTIAALPNLDVRTDVQNGAGAFVSKRIGQTRRQGQLGNQPAICDVCCRDHHDATSVTLKYDPFGATPAGPGGDHNHYGRNSSGNLVLRNGNNDEYLEVCRFQRVNGELLLAQDWRLESLVVVPDSYLTSFRGNYIDYIDQFIRDYINGITLGSYPTITPTPTPVLANAPTEINIAGLNSNVQTQARALYIDYMSDAQITDLKSRLAMDADAVILPYVPWFEVNTTRLANWSVGNSARITVTSQPITNGSETTYSRGRVTSVSGGTSFVQALLERGNAGLTDSFLVDPLDLVAAASFTRQLTVNVSASPTPPTARTAVGSINISGQVSDVEQSDVVVIGTGGAACTKPTQGSYSCSLTSTGGGTVSFQNFQGVLVDPVTMLSLPPNQICPGASFTYTGVATTVTQDVLVIDDTEICSP